MKNKILGLLVCLMMLTLAVGLSGCVTATEDKDSRIELSAPAFTVSTNGLVEWQPVQDAWGYRVNAICQYVNTTLNIDKYVEWTKDFDTNTFSYNVGSYGLGKSKTDNFNIADMPSGTQIKISVQAIGGEKKIGKKFQVWTDSTSDMFTWTKP